MEINSFQRSTTVPEVLDFKARSELDPRTGTWTDGMSPPNEGCCAPVGHAFFFLKCFKDLFVA